MIYARMHIPQCMLCYIFDVDDTLIKYENFDMREWYEFIAEPVARKMKIPMNFEIWKDMIEGKISRRYTERYGILAEKFWQEVDRRNLLYRKVMWESGRLKLYEDVKILKELPGKKIAWSTSSTDCIRYVFSLFNLEKYFDLIVGKDFENYRYVERVKPDPTFLNIIKSAVRCTTCIVIGDDEKDMKAAKNAGCIAVLITRRLRSSRYADLVIHSLGELKDLDKKFL